MTTPSGAHSEDDYWRRPAPDEPTAGPTGQPAPGPTGQPAQGPAGQPATGPAGAGSAPQYTGPPPTTPPPAGWRPPVHLQPAPPRRLPPQDMAGLDAAEQHAQRLTYGFGAVAGVVLLILTCVLCSRVIF